MGKLLRQLLCKLWTTANIVGVASRVVEGAEIVDDAYLCTNLVCRAGGVR